MVALYLSPPQNAIVFSVDEKPSIQAIMRAAGFVPAGKKVVQGNKSTYKRNGTTTLFTALEIATGKVIGKTNKKPRPAKLYTSLWTTCPPTKSAMNGWPGIRT